LFLVFLLLPGGGPGRPADQGASGDCLSAEPAQAEDAAIDGVSIRLEGQVYDAQGSPAPEARVLASGRRVHREASSATDGRFVIESLPPGVYTIQAVASGASSQPARVTIDAGVDPPPVLLVLEAAQQVEATMRPRAAHSPGQS
jgi:protocatechuate 3,4-dioxygenase beta subunit